uniref:Elongation of very long chain fatty acids protein n=1 Tax=Stomoxys calcitrans TaxID=35570 RepID=A0A1I8P5H7_STOCA
MMNYIGTFLDFVDGYRLDKRVTTHPVLSSPWCLIIGVTLYLLVVKRWGPRFMANRKPYNVEGIMMAFNVMQIILNLYIFVASLRHTYWRSDFSLTCEAYNPDDMRPETLNFSTPALWYLISKYFDFLDTIFFILRKKFNQISFLHVFHHTSVAILVHIYTANYFASHLTSTGIINSFVHLVMYSYYQLAAMKLNINLQPWKRLMTQLQMFQFLLLAIHFSLPLINNWCKIETGFIALCCVENVCVTALFANFYYKTYIRKDRKKVSNNGTTSLKAQ